MRPTNQKKEKKSTTPVCGNETVLVVEDEDTVRELVVEALRKCGHNVVEAPDGPTALEKFGESGARIDLLLTDVIMPHMDGKELATRFREIYPDLKVLFMSGYTDDVIVSHGVLAPDTPFVHKPFTTTELTRKIREVLAQE